MPERKKPDSPKPGPTLDELVERAKRIRAESEDLIRQLRELASQSTEMKAKAEHRMRKPPR